jgi:1-phosphofructokinase
MRSVLTVTLNPAFDRTVWLERLVQGATNRALVSTLRVGGKGINVARAVAARGLPAIAVGFAGEDQATPLERALRADGIEARFVRVPGDTRTNLKLIEQQTGRMTEVNEPGPSVDADAVRAVEAVILEAVGTGDVAVVVLAGSLPLGVAPAVYAGWVTQVGATASAPSVLVDASEAALAAVVPAGPFLVKPNRVEAEALLGRSIPDRAAALDAAREILGRGPRAVLMSLGADGAVAAIDGIAEAIEPEPIPTGDGRLTSTVGAGDAMVARVAAGLVERNGTAGALGTAEFFELCRRAVRAASEQIRGGV